TLDAGAHGPQVAVVGERHAFRTARRARGVEHHRRLARLRVDRREIARAQEGLEAVLALRVEVDEGKAGRNERPALTIAEDQVHARVAQDEVDGVPRELVINGDGDETWAHRPEVGDEELRAVRGKNGHRVAPAEPAGEEPSRAGVGELVNLAVG